MSRTIHRPLSVTIITWFVLIIAAMNLLRLIQVILQWNFLLEVIPVHPAYLAVSGFIWGVSGLALVWGLLRGFVWAPGLTRIFMVGYAVYYWLDRLFLFNPVDKTTNLFFLMSLTVIMILWVFWSFSRQGAKDYFGEYHEY